MRPFFDFLAPLIANIFTNFNQFLNSPQIFLSIVFISSFYTILFFTVKENDKTTIGLIKQACPHLLIEHGNQGLDSTGKFLTKYI